MLYRLQDLNATPAGLIMEKMRRFVFCCLFLLILPGVTPALAAPYDDTIGQVRQQLAVIRYRTPDQAEQKAAIFALKHQAIDLGKVYPNKAEPMILQAAIDVTKADIDSNYGSLLLIQQARDLLLQADKISPKALHALGPAILGSLYHEAPEPPLSFGDQDLAKKYLEKAVALNPSGLDTNYFYGKYLHDTGDDANAKTLLTKALAAPVQTDNEIGDKARRAEIKEILGDIDPQE